MKYEFKCGCKSWLLCLKILGSAWVQREEKTGIRLVIFYACEGSRGQSLSPIQNTQTACPRLLTRIIIFALKNDGNSLGRDLASKRPTLSSLMSRKNSLKEND